MYVPSPRVFRAPWGLACAVLIGVLLFAPVDARAARPRPAAPTPTSARLAAWQEHQALDAASLLRGLPWRCVGPIAQGGRLVDIEVHPQEPYTFYVAYASGGVWRTTNNGLSFEPLFDHQPTTVIGDIAIDPSDPRTLWVGTGENNSSRSSYGGLGVFVSHDAGATWEAKGLEDTDRIGRILVDPRDGRRVLVAAAGRLYTESGDRGLYLTEDGGTTWTRVLEGRGMTGFIDLALEPGNPDVVYAAAWERSRRPWNFVESGSGSGLYKSTDAGRTWTRLSGLPEGEHVGRIGLALSPAAPQTVYAFVDNQEILPESEWDAGDGAVNAKSLRTMTKEEFLQQDPEEIEDFVRGADLHPSISGEKLTEMIENDEITVQQLLATLTDANANLFTTDIRAAEVWRSDDAGATWRRTHTSPIRDMVYTYGYYFGQIRVAPDDPQRLYIMGVPILRSDDGGATWYGLDDRVVHVDYQSMHIDDEHAQHLKVGNDGGLAMSWDGGLTWLESNKIPVGQFYTVAVDMAEPYNIYGGLQDNGTWKGSSRSEPDDASAWRFLNGGDGFYVQVDTRDDQTVYTGYQFGYYTRIDPDGSRHRVRPRNQLTESALRYNWMTPIQLSSHNQDILYFGTNRLFRSMDKGETWVAISEDLTRNPSRGDVPFGTITTLDESAQTFGLIWVGTDDGQVWLTRDGGVSWTDVAGALPRDRWVTRVESSAHVRERAYVSLNGYRDDDMTPYLYRTDDLGAKWISIAKGLPAEPINVVREDPVNEDVLYVGTDRGVYVSLDRGATWTSMPNGLPSVPVHDLVVHPRDKELVAGTHGRSVWVIDVEPVQMLTEEFAQKDLFVYAIDEVQAERGWRSRPSLWFHRPEEDDPTHDLRVWAKQAGPATIEIRDEDDRVLRTIDVELIAGVNQIEWDLRLDPDLALEAERAREAAAASESDADSVATPQKGILAKTPWAEAVRLGYPLLITAGEYTVRVVRDGASAEETFTVKAPPARPARTTGPLTRPGKLHP